MQSPQGAWIVLRREKQVAYNTEHGITPTTIKKAVAEAISAHYSDPAEQEAAPRKRGWSPAKSAAETAKEIAKVKQEMWKAAEDLEFERAAELRDRLKELEQYELRVR